MYGIKDNFEQIWDRNEPNYIGLDRGYDSECCPSYQQFMYSNKPILFAWEELRSLGIYDEFINQFKNQMIKFSYVYESEFTRPTRVDSIVAWKEGAKPRALRLIDLYQNSDIRRAEFHREVGYLLGYPMDQVNAFVQGGIARGTYITS